MREQCEDTAVIIECLRLIAVAEVEWQKQRPVVCSLGLVCFGVKR